jgi:hypothetical protein
MWWNQFWNTVPTIVEICAMRSENGICPLKGEDLLRLMKLRPAFAHATGVQIIKP